MFKKIIRVVIFIPIAVVLILLSIANRQSVTLALNPFEPTDTLLSVSAPFFVFLFIALMLGMVLGSLITWFKQGKHRQRARQEAAESTKWHVEADRQKEKAESLASQMVTTNSLAVGQTTACIEVKNWPKNHGMQENLQVQDHQVQNLLARMGVINIQTRNLRAFRITNQHRKQSQNKWLHSRNPSALHAKVRAQTRISLLSWKLVIQSNIA